jgi:hypothetical protein
MKNPESPVPQRKQKKAGTPCFVDHPAVDYDSKEFRKWCALNQAGRYLECRRCGYWLNEDRLPRVDRLSYFRGRI